MSPSTPGQITGVYNSNIASGEIRSSFRFGFGAGRVRTWRFDRVLFY
jgi:hypothetical protein